MTASDLYDRDFLEWTRCNAALLRRGRFDQADVLHIADEIEDMGISQRHAAFNRLKILMVHLLQWRMQPGKRSPSWAKTMDTQRDRLELLVEDAPSLRTYLEKILPRVYEKAVRAAGRDTALPRECFPPACPFTLEQILDGDFFPD